MPRTGEPRIQDVTFVRTSFPLFAISRDPVNGGCAEFLEMLKSPDIHAIFCARGGYGSGTSDSRSDAGSDSRRIAKIVNGSSDITLLLNWIERAGVVSFHGPMVATAYAKERGLRSRMFFWICSKGSSPVRFPTDSTSVLRSGNGRRPADGRCLSLVVATLGTKHEIDTDDSILVLEDHRHEAVSNRPHDHASEASGKIRSRSRRCFW